jgi:hypothetical protein
MRISETATQSHCMGQFMIVGPNVEGSTILGLPNPCLWKIYFALHARRSAHRLALVFVFVHVCVLLWRSAHRLAFVCVHVCLFMFVLMAVGTPPKHIIVYLEHHSNRNILAQAVKQQFD